MVSSTSAECAMASKCNTALVEPPIAMITAIAFSNAFRVMISRGRILCLIICMSVSAQRPVFSSFSLSSFAMVEL